MLKKLLIFFRRQKRYKVTRTWYVWADSPVKAIEQSKYIAHDEVESGMFKISEVCDE